MSCRTSSEESGSERRADVRRHGPVHRRAGRPRRGRNPRVEPLAAVAAAAACAPAWAATAAGRAAAGLPGGGRHPRSGAATRSSRGSRARPGCTFGFGMFQMGFVPGLFRQAAALAYAPLGQVIPSDHPGTLALGIRRPVGVVGRDRALERGADPLGPLDRGAARARQHRRAEAVRVVAVLGRSPLGRDLRRGRAARPACSTSSRMRPARPARSATSWSRTRPCAGSTSPARPRPAGGSPRRPAGNLKRVLLELGGSNPLIVLADADLDYAVTAAAFGAFLHQGQICMSARRIIVERPIADEFIAQARRQDRGLKAGDPQGARTRSSGR